MNEFRIWQAPLSAWQDVARALDSEGSYLDLQGAIDARGEAYTAGEVVELRLPLDECAYLREVTKDLGLEDQFEDITP